MKDPIFSSSRRRFLKNAAAAAITVPFIVRNSPVILQTGGKLRHACVGVGGMMGWADLLKFKNHPDVNIAAICDVDSVNLKKASEALPDARTYSDWRELLKKERDIDSINVTVPDHNHFGIAYTAIRNGKHVYCQKPMCHDVAEVRALTEASVKAGVITQLGTQIASSAGDRMAVRMIKEGIIGKVKHAYLCSNRPGAVEKYRLTGPRPSKFSEAPASLDWELWIGTAPMRDFAPKIYHPVVWRTWLDFGTGWSGDIGCHIFDAVWKGLGLKAPISVKAEVQESWKASPERRADTWPQSDHITWIFPGTDLTEDLLPVEWFDGDYYPPEEIMNLFPGKEYPAESSMLIGTKGALLLPHRGMPVLLPEKNFSDYKPAVPGPADHYHSFIDACLGGPKTESHFAQSGPMTEAILLGTVAVQVPDQLLKWDAVKMKFPNYPDANKYLSRDYRKGWKIAGF